MPRRRTKSIPYNGYPNRGAPTKLKEEEQSRKARKFLEMPSEVWEIFMDHYWRGYNLTHDELIEIYVLTGSKYQTTRNWFTDFKKIKDPVGQQRLWRAAKAATLAAQVQAPVGNLANAQAPVADPTAHPAHPQDLDVDENQDQAPMEVDAQVHHPVQLLHFNRDMPQAPIAGLVAPPAHLLDLQMDQAQVPMEVDDVPQAPVYVRGLIAPPHCRPMGNSKNDCSIIASLNVLFQCLPIRHRLATRQPSGTGIADFITKVFKEEKVQFIYGLRHKLERYFSNPKGDQNINRVFALILKLLDEENVNLDELRIKETTTTKCTSNEPPPKIAQRMFSSLLMKDSSDGKTFQEVHEQCLTRSGPCSKSDCAKDCQRIVSRQFSSIEDIPASGSYHLVSVENVGNEPRFGNFLPNEVVTMYGESWMLVAFAYYKKSLAHYISMVRRDHTSPTSHWTEVSDHLMQEFDGMDIQLGNFDVTSLLFLKI